MHRLGKGFGQTVCQSLQQDLGIIIACSIKRLGIFFLTKARGNSKATDIIRNAAIRWRDEIAHGNARTRRPSGHLLAQPIERAAS